MSKESFTKTAAGTSEESSSSNNFQPSAGNSEEGKTEEKLSNFENKSCESTKRKKKRKFPPIVFNCQCKLSADA
jgi:hypothetical protein